MKLIWKAVVGYEGYYEVSNYGEVRSLDRVVKHSSEKVLTVKSKKMKAKVDGKYRSLGLSKDGKRKKFRLHKLVADAFLPPCPGKYGIGRGKYQIDHIDDNPLNNRADNLQWLKHEDNCYFKNEETHYFKTMEPHRGTKHGRAKLTEAQVRRIKNDNRSHVAVAKEYGVHASLIGLIRRGKIWKHVTL